MGNQLDSEHSHPFTVPPRLSTHWHTHPHSDILIDKKTNLHGQLATLTLTTDIARHVAIYKLRQSSQTGLLPNILAMYYPAERNYLTKDEAGSNHSSSYFPTIPAPTLPWLKNRVIELEVDVVTEHVPYRLHQINNLSEQEATYIVACVLEGLWELVGYIGLYRSGDSLSMSGDGLSMSTFTVRENMIGVTANGKIKVWCHSNYGVNGLQDDDDK